MNYQREANYLKDKMGKVVKDLVSEHGAIIAGGAVTSAFSDAPINDFDLFLPTEKALADALSAVRKADTDKASAVETDSALSVILNGHRVQVVKVLTGPADKIIDSFDFTICQGAFTDDAFVLGTDFLRHLAQRRLVFNISAGYPICSLYRACKFMKRGFHLSGIEAIKLGLCIQALKIETIADLRVQLMGIDTLFLKELTDSLKGQASKDYSLNEFLNTLNGWLDKLDTLTGQD